MPTFYKLFAIDPRNIETESASGFDGNNRVDVAPTLAQNKTVD